MEGLVLQNVLLAKGLEKLVLVDGDGRHDEDTSSMPCLERGIVRVSGGASRRA